jgi:hypothetical protein
MAVSYLVSVLSEKEKLQRGSLWQPDCVQQERIRETAIQLVVISHLWSEDAYRNF